jgi:hypothetical protein
LGCWHFQIRRRKHFEEQQMNGPTPLLAFALRGTFHGHPWIAVASFVAFLALAIWIKRRADYD